MKTLISFTGPSAAGKTTLVRVLREHLAGGGLQIEPVVSHTTRFMRAGEVDGVDYYFVAPAVFDRLSGTDGGFVESISMVGQQYGLHLAELRRIWATGRHPVVMLDPTGLEQTVTYCRNNQIRFMPFYIDERLSVMLARYLERVRSDTTAVDYHARRVESLIAEAGSWRELFKNLVGSGPCGYVNSFQGNEQVALQGMTATLRDVFNPAAAPNVQMMREHDDNVPELDTLQQLQAEAVQWADSVFPNRTPSSAFLKMFSELGEIIDCPTDGLEWADLFVLALDLMKMHGITDPASYIRQKLATNRERSWQVGANDVMSHVKGE
jgi:guanylate kinase